MPTTSFKLPNDAKLAQKRAEFVARALDSRLEALESGKGYPAQEVHAWVQARAKGKPALKPKSKTWRK